MLRTAIKPRWLGLLLLVIVVNIAFARLGYWQLGVAQHRGDAELAARPAEPVRPIGDVIDVHQPFPNHESNSYVTATGSYDAAGQVLVAPRLLNEQRGSWVVTPLQIPGSGTIAILRGFVPEGAPAPAPPTGPVTVVGTLAPSESPAEDAATQPPGQLGSVDLSILVNTWPTPLYNAFLFAVEETEAGADISGIDRVPPPTKPRPLEWRNVAYALQWWLFAVFAAWMWLTMVRNDANPDRASSNKRHNRDDPTDTPAPSVTIGSDSR